MIPAIVQLELTSKCNYLCQHCYRLDSSGQEISREELPDEDMIRIAEILAENKLFFVTLTGGEPLMRKKLVVELVDFLSKKGIKVSLNTNLILLDQSTFTKLSLYGVLASCPSTDPDAYKLITRGGSYQRFANNLKMLIESGQSHIVNMVVSKLNADQVRQTAENLKKMGVKNFAATPASLNAEFPRPDLLLSLEEFRETLDDLVWIHENLGMHVDVMEALPKCIIPQRAYELNLPFIGRTCFAGRRNGTISPMGDVRPCGHNPNTFGNILTEPISDIWERLQYWRKDTGNTHRNCLACDVYNSCEGGCVFSGHPIAPKLDIKEIDSNVNDSKKSTDLLAKGLVVKPYKKIMSRKDGSGWLLCSNSPRNLLFVNEQLYFFIINTRNLQPITLGELAKLHGTEYEDEFFQAIMRELIAKSFFIVCDKRVG
ncbi:radical SAM protein [Candidatus Falkowbacteria bacterium]|nr:radical SAM protein [Candidatus Falkowbacteria bacterium]